MPSRPLAVSAGVVAALVLAAGAATLLPGAAPPAAAQGLVPYEGCGALLEQYRAALARSATPWGLGSSGFGHGDVATSTGGMPMPVAAGAAGTAEDAAAPGPVGEAVGSGPTGTNLQERGVDEPDIAKTTGELLLALSEDRLQVLSRRAQPEVLGTAALGPDAYGAELLVDGDRVLVLVPHAQVFAHDSAGVATSAPTGSGSGGMRALLFDVSDPRTPRQLEELTLEGRYLSARLADGAVRLVTSSSPQAHGTQPAAPYAAEQERAALEANRRAAQRIGLSEVLPRLQRRLPGGRVVDDRQAVACQDVRHAPSSSHGASTLLVTTLDLGEGLRPKDTTGVTTDGDLVYASADRLYVATSRWGTTAPPADDAPAPPASSGTSTTGTSSEVTTELHAFDISSPERTAYTGSASVAGYVMGRWALSSYDGHLRVATTSAPPWSGGETRASESSLVVLEELDDGLVVTGRVDGLGLGERIYAVRYFGDLATVVTFRQTDPLYVLDLGDPKAPTLLGELKVPGFSTYLHPVGDDLLLGVGQDADAQGRVTGMQVSLFDLSDRRRPVQLDRLSLGQGWSPAGEDSRAFGYVPQRRTALLPFSRWTTAPDNSALGIRVEGRRLVEAGRMTVSVQAPAERVLHDGDHLYAVSRSGVVAGALDGFARTGAVGFRR